MKQTFYEYLVSYTVHEKGNLRLLSLGHSVVVLDERFANNPRAMEDLQDDIMKKLELDIATTIVHVESVRFRRRYVQREKIDWSFKWPWEVTGHGN